MFKVEAILKQQRTPFPHHLARKYKQLHSTTEGGKNYRGTQFMVKMNRDAKEKGKTLRKLL